jgi:hypothetical protein
MSPSDDRKVVANTSSSPQTAESGGKHRADDYEEFPTKMPERVAPPTVNAIPQPNRMIRLFQSKADIAYAKYLAEKRKPRVSAEHLKELLLVQLQTQFETWHKAAELLRKEELNK